MSDDAPAGKRMSRFLKAMSGDFETLIMSIIWFGIAAAVIMFILVGFVFGNGSLVSIGHALEAGVVVVVIMEVIVWLLSGRMKAKIEF
jgi:hypothetical protein